MNTYFNINIGKAKPYIDKDGKNSSANRLVPLQPLAFQTSYNIRKLMELPLHIVNTGDMDLMKKEVFCNLRWLDAKLRATSYRWIYLSDTRYLNLIIDDV